MSTAFTKCAVCQSPSLNRLCEGCAMMSETFTALNSEQPTKGLLSLMGRLRRSRLTGAFYYLRVEQIRLVEQIVQACQQAGNRISKSETIRLAVQIGLTAIRAMNPDELEQTIAELEAHSKR